MSSGVSGLSSRSWAAAVSEVAVAEGGNDLVIPRQDAFFEARLPCRRLRMLANKSSSLSDSSGTILASSLRLTGKGVFVLDPSNVTGEVNSCCRQLETGAVGRSGCCRFADMEVVGLEDGDMSKAERLVGMSRSWFSSFAISLAVDCFAFPVAVGLVDTPSCPRARSSPADAFVL